MTKNFFLLPPAKIAEAQFVFYILSFSFFCYLVSIKLNILLILSCSVIISFLLLSYAYKAPLITLVFRAPLQAGLPFNWGASNIPILTALVNVLGSVNGSVSSGPIDFIASIIILASLINFLSFFEHYHLLSYLQSLRIHS